MDLDRIAELSDARTSVELKINGVELSPTALEFNPVRNIFTVVLVTNAVEVK